jgi:hypothetical protein
MSKNVQNRYTNIPTETDPFGVIAGYFTSDNEPDGIENATTHNTFAK